MNIPTWEEFSLYLKEEKKMRIPQTFYGKFEYIRNYFLVKLFNEHNLKVLFSEVKQDLYYRQNGMGFAQTMNEYIFITRLIAEYNAFQKKQAADVSNTGSLMMTLTWEDLRRFYYVRKHNRCGEEFYKDKFRDMQEYFKDKSYTLEHVEGFFTYLQDRFKSKHNQEISPSYYNKYISIMRTIDKLLKSDIMENFQGLHIIYKETEILTSDEVDRLLTVTFSYSRETAYINHRWTTLIKTLIITTCRPGELQQANWDDLKGNYLHFAITKNGESHKVFIPDLLLQDIKKLKVHNHGYIFGSPNGKFNKAELNREIKQRCIKAGITKNITARSMRGTGITSYLKKYNPHQVAKISNHKTIDTIYRHYYKPDENEIKDMVRHNEIQPDELRWTPLSKQSRGEK